MKFVRVILIEYFLEEIFNNVRPIIKKVRQIIDGVIYLKIGEYKMYLSGQDILIESLNKSCLIESNCFSMIKTIVSTKDIQRLKYLIQESQRIIQSRL